MYEQRYSDYSTVVYGNSEHVSPCPSREKRTWNRIWNGLNRKHENKKELDQIKEEHKIDISDISDKEIHELPEESNVVNNIEALCNTTYCNIKMQDPCEICCCTVCRAEEDSPCEGVPRGQRKSVCECHPDEKFKKEHECCDACEHHGLRRV